MATTRKRKTTGAARGRKAAPKRKRKTRVNGVTAAPSTVTIKGRGRYKKTMCGLTKTEAASRVKKIGATGYKAMSRKNPAGGYCVYKGGRKKAA